MWLCFNKPDLGFKLFSKKVPYKSFLYELSDVLARESRMRHSKCKRGTRPNMAPVFAPKSPLEVLKHQITQSGKRVECYQCKTRVRTHCKECKIPLCKSHKNCFIKYHKHLWQVDDTHVNDNNDGNDEETDNTESDDYNFPQSPSDSNNSSNQDEQLFVPNEISQMLVE